MGLLLFDTGNRIGGMRWLKSAAEQGEPRALLIYGTALFNGDGVVRDPVLAYAYVSRAAAQGLAPAKTTLAEMDQIIPLDQRQKGVALALAKAAPAKAAPAKAAPVTAAKAAAKAMPAKAAQPPRQPPNAGRSHGRDRWHGGCSSAPSPSARRPKHLFKKLSGSGALAGRQPFYVAAGAITRLQAGPFESRAAAAAACAALSAKGQPCFPVSAK